jgi:uncharacterized damage-inducible protein DinB
MAMNTAPTLNMPGVETLHELVRHMEWADACVWRAVLEHPAAVRDERLRDLLLHLHGVQRGFLAVWTSQPLDAGAAAATWDLVSAHSAVRAYYGALHAAITSFDDEALLRPIVMPGLEPLQERMGRRFEVPTLGDTIFQVVSHSTYHRGQVNGRLREVGGEPPLVDYIAWIWFGRPSPEWTDTVFAHHVQRLRSTGAPDI